MDGLDEFEVTISEFHLLCCHYQFPTLYHLYWEHALFVDEVDLTNSDGTLAFLAVGRECGWPYLVVAQRYSPAGFGFHPGVLLVPETRRLFVGAGTRLLCYDLGKPARLWEDQADLGFWRWNRHGAFVLMAAETELAAWDTIGRKRWTTFVEPPWRYRVDGDLVHLDVMGTLSSFPVETGPP